MTRKDIIATVTGRKHDYKSGVLFLVAHTVYTCKFHAESITILIGYTISYGNHGLYAFLQFQVAQQYIYRIAHSRRNEVSGIGNISPCVLQMHHWEIGSVPHFGVSRNRKNKQQRYGYL